MTSYWLERGLSLFQSGRVLLALEELDRRQVEIRISGTSRVHAKLYRGDGAITIGSSNYSRSGMELQMEGNVRIEQGESPRFEEVCALGEAIWEIRNELHSFSVICNWATEFKVAAAAPPGQESRP